MLGFLAGSDTLSSPAKTHFASCNTLAVWSSSASPGTAKVTEHIPWIAAPLHQLGLHSHMLLGSVAQDENCGPKTSPNVATNAASVFKDLPLREL